MSAPAEIELPPVTGPQMRILHIDESAERCHDVEGSPRGAKSWGAALWIWKLAYKYPGIQIFYCRYKDEGLAQLREVWSKVMAKFPPYLHPVWNTVDQAWDFPNGRMVGQVYTGSRVLFSSLKVSEAADAAAIHGKYKGKTIAVVVIEEAQEVPRANYQGLKERLSQGQTPLGEPFRYPLKIVLVHNSVDEDHWIAQEFPLDAEGRCTRDGHAHIRADLYSNEQNLGPDVMKGYEEDYPVGHSLRRTVIEGKRGVTLVGQPVYSGSFSRTKHVNADVQFQPYYPLLEGWDYGQEKPAVVWAQYISHLARFQILGAVKGSYVYLEQWAPRIIEMRRRLFPQHTQVRSWCDPTGVTGNGGMAYTPVRVLHELGVPVQPAKDSTSPRDGNDPEVRGLAIQTLAGYMTKTGTDGLPGFLMSPVCFELEWQKERLVEKPSSILITAFEAGYVWDSKAASDSHPNTRKPKKGTRYDDLQNALEYIVIGEAIPAAPNTVQLATAAAKYQTAPEREQLKQMIAARVALRAAQKDTHPIDNPKVRIARMGAGRRAFY